MSQDKIKQLLAELHEALESTEEVDEETLALARKLDSDIDALIDSAENRNSPILDDAIALEAQFAANHPMAERIMRELVATLGRMGI